MDSLTVFPCCCIVRSPWNSFETIIDMIILLKEKLTKSTPMVDMKLSLKVFF